MSKDKKKIKEAAPIGSFGYTREKVSNAIYNSKQFDPDGDGDNDNYNCSIAALFPDRVVVECGEDFYELPYSIDDTGNVTFGDSTKVEQYFTATENNVVRYKVKESTQKAVKESAVIKELRESGIEIIKEGVEQDFETGYMNCHIQEGSFNPDSGEVTVILIEAGTNELKRRHYPDNTIKESVGIYKGMKMYINHQTAKEEQERPERDIKDWAATIMESYSGVNTINGRAQALGKVVIHEPWLRERMGDKVWASQVGLSINTGGKIAYGKINGQEMQIVEKINPTRSNGSGSVDWVTEAGARGRVTRPLQESATKTGEDMNKTLKEASIEDLQKENPELFKKIQESGKEKPSADAALVEVNALKAKLERKDKLSDQKEKVLALLKEAKTLPEQTKTRILDTLQETLYEDDAKLQEAVKNRIAGELAYINSLPGTKGKIVIPAAGEAAKGDKPLKESLQENLEGRFNIKAPEDKNKK